MQSTGMEMIFFYRFITQEQPQSNLIGKGAAFRNDVDLAFQTPSDFDRLQRMPWLQTTSKS
jgi:hypothetical protein